MSFLEVVMVHSCRLIGRDAVWEGILLYWCLEGKDEELRR